MADVKLFRPQRLTDNPDGGGLATATEIVDGEVNNLVDDISRIDRVNGELSLRKVFVIAATPDTEIYADVHAIVQAPPLDPRVSAVIFRTNEWGDEREDAQAYVERYLDPSVITRMIPYDRQLEGQRTVLVYQRPELSLPEIGEVYALGNDATGQSEFVRVQDVDHVVQTFTDTQGDFQARVITLTISQPLTQEFAGSQPNRFFEAGNLKSILRSTIASDAARYKGVVALAEDADVGDLTIRVESIFAQLVPAATSEVAVTDAVPEGAVLLEPSSNSLLMIAHTPQSGALTVHLPTAAARGVTVNYGFTAGASENRWEEQPDGSFLRTAGSSSITMRMNASRTALETANVGATGQNSLFVTYRPAVLIAKASQSHQVPVEIANRGYVYVATLVPLPVAGTMTVAFRALGKWYTLRDDGTGALAGEPGVGTGLVNPATGTVSVTLGALPDVGSAVIFSWGTSSEYEIRTGDLNIRLPAITIQLGAGSCEPGTLTVVWEAGGVPKTASSDTAGEITGDATGRVIHATGEVVLRPAVLPDSASLFTCSYEAGSTEQEVFTPSASGGTVVVSAAAAPIRPGSVELGFLVYAEVLAGATSATPIRLLDDGAGGLEFNGELVAGSAIDYSDGQITFPTTYLVDAAILERADFGGVLPARTAPTPDAPYSMDPRVIRVPSGVSRGEVVAGFLNGSAVGLRYKADSAIDQVFDEEHEAGPLELDLTPRVRSSIVPGGVLFTFAGRTYYDRQGTIYYGQSTTNGAGTVGGSIDYQSGVVALTHYAGGAVPALSTVALLTELAALPLYVVHGRTPGSPLRPGTFTIRANRAADGVLISATASNNGNIDTPDMHGVVDSTNGVYSVAFGRYVLDSTLTTGEKAEDWYDPASVDGNGYIWRPAEVVAGSIRYNCVVQASLPQDPEIIKVNPVRLPMDGRVPVLRPGDTLVIHDPQPYTLPGGLAAGQVVSLPREGLASVALYDQAGLGVPTALFEVDLVDGSIEMADPLDLAGYVQPLVAIHSVEDMALCLDVQITGEVSLGQALTHGYSAGNALVSSAQILGDAQARYGQMFAQGTWTGAWSDTLIGNPPVGGAQYNDAVFPIEVLNRDAITQRWRLAFTSPTAFNVIGEELGVVGSGTTATGAAPLNPATGEPYFEVLPAGFGGGWATGNNLRFNTFAAGGPIWVARTVRSGPATNLDDRIRLQVRWDKD